MGHGNGGAQMANLVQNVALMKKDHVGVEIEMGKISKQRAMHIVSKYFCDTYGIPVNEWHGGPHDAWNCDGKPDANGNRRVWKFMDDGSSSGDWGSITCEMVTPILAYDDIPDLQAIVRLLRGAGARSGAHWNAGVHIHVDVRFDEPDGHNARSIRNLINLVASHETMLREAIGFSRSRLGWARPVEPRVLRDVNRVKPKTKDQLESIWYNGRGWHGHYDDTRYHLLNLHAIWDKNTIEFRCFEFHNNLHAGELKAWIQLCLAMSNYCKLVRNCSWTPVATDNPKFQMKNWLNNMGLIGDEFKTCRKLLLKNLRGDTATRRPRSTADDLDVLTGDYSVPDTF